MHKCKWCCDKWMMNSLYQHLQTLAGVNIKWAPGTLKPTAYICNGKNIFKKRGKTCCFTEGCSGYKRARKTNIALQVWYSYIFKVEARWARHIIVMADLCNALHTFTTTMCTYGNSRQEANVWPSRSGPFIPCTFDPGGQLGPLISWLL